MPVRPTRTDGMSPIGVSNVLGWQPAGSFEKSTHCPRRERRRHSGKRERRATCAGDARRTESSGTLTCGRAPWRYDERMRRVLVWRPLAPVLVGFVVSAQPAAAKPEYTRKTTKDCAFCHQPPGYNLNERREVRRRPQPLAQGLHAAAKKPCRPSPRAPTDRCSSSSPCPSSSRPRTASDRTGRTCARRRCASCGSRCSAAPCRRRAATRFVSPASEDEIPPAVGKPRVLHVRFEPHELV